MTFAAPKVDGPEIDVNGPQINGHGDADISGPSIDVDLPKSSINGDVDINAPKVKTTLYICRITQCCVN